jgi:hypothetical protein
VLQFSKVCLLLVTFLCTIAFPAGAETFPDERPQVIVSVYDDAGVPATVLAQAEQEAAKIFDRAGLHVIWKECSLNHGGPDALARAGERSSPGLGQESSSDLGHERSPASNPAGFGLENLACASVEWPTHLAVRVVPRSRLATNEVFGVAFLSARGEGCYSDIFYDRVMELHVDWTVSLADTLGNVMAHELGHLLLGSNSHSGMGIMRAHWQNEELRRLSRGGLWFTNEQADRMTGKLNRARPAGELAAHSGY